jgi:hypothetical protein
LTPIGTTSGHEPPNDALASVRPPLGVGTPRTRTPEVSGSG